MLMLSNLALADNNDHLQSQIDDNRNAAQAARQLSEQVNSKADQNGADIQDMARCNGEWGNMSVCQGVAQEEDNKLYNEHYKTIE